MTTLRGRAHGAWFAAAAALALGSLVLAGPPAGPDAGQTVTEIRVSGNREVSEHQIRGQIKTRPGQRFDRAAVQQDIAGIYSLGKFVSVTPETQAADGGIILTFVVVEKPRVQSVEYRGAKAIKFAELAGETGFAVGDFVDSGQLAMARQRIRSLYRGKGYYFAEVTVNGDALATGNVVFTVREGPRVKVRKILFRGNNSFTAARLKREILTGTYMWIFNPGILDATQAAEDAYRLQRFYNDQGFLDARVGSPQFNFSGDQKDVAVVFVIDEGARYRVNEVAVEGSRVMPVADIRAAMRLQPGQYFTAAERAADTDAVRDGVYGACGYIDTQVEIRYGYADEPGKVNLVVSVVEGPRVTVGRVQIINNTVTQADKVIRPRLTVFPEEPYNVLQARASQRRLMDTQLFSDVKITPAAGGADNVRDVIVRVEEGKTRHFMVGVGVSSDSGLLGNISLENRNFDLFAWPRSWQEMFSGTGFAGAGQTLRIVAEPGTELNRFQVQFFDPNLFKQPYDQAISLGSNLFYFSRPREAYDERRVGYIVSLGKQLPRNWLIEGGARVEGIDISDVDDDAADDIKDAEGSHFLVAPKLSVIRDTTDSRWLPTTGDRLSLSGEPVMGSESFVKMLADYRAYRTVRTDVMDRKTVLSGRGTIGYIAGDAPIFERFYAGGINSLRGFKYRGVGPHAGVDEDPIGGHFMVLLGGEYAFPLIGKSQGVFFVDTGTVEETATITDYRASVGFEVRIPIPIFNSIPLTVGVAAPVSKAKDDETQWFHFMFGTSF